MKKFFCLLLNLCITSICPAQKDDAFSVKINAPKMSELVEKLWVDLPTDCVKVPASVTIDKGEEYCASFVLYHFRQTITGCKMKDAFKEAIKLEFKLLKLLPVGKLAGYALDVADLSAKALSASSPEALEGDLVKYGFGKFIGDKVVGKLKDWTKIPEGEEGDVLANLTKLFYKQLWDKAKEAILPKEEKFDCQPGGTCNDDIHMSIEPYTGEDSKVIGKLVFSANGDCKCQATCKAGIGYSLKDWSLHGEMLLVIDKAEVTGWRTKTLEITIKAQKPTYHVQANCDCTQGSNMNYENNSNTFFVGLGLINEDANNRFNTYGANIAYKHLLNATTVGITGDAGAYFGKNNSTHYTKLQLLAGITLIPSMQKGMIMFAPHALVGLANIHSKYGAGNYSSSASSTSFAAAIGTDIMARLKQAFAVGVRFDYNPVFSKGGVSHNFRLSAGFDLKMKKTK